MNVSLTPQLEELIDQKVRSGRYHTASEVVREALRLFEQQERLRELRLEELKKEVAIGLEELDRGQSKPFDQAAVERIKNNGRKKLEAKRGKKP